MTAGPARGELLITPHRPAEELFGLGPIEVSGDTARGSMTTVAWMTDAAGRPSAGMLGVLLDDVVGQATLTARPEGCWPVTTELSIDVLGGLPADGTVLVAESELLVGGERAGTARGEVRGPAGRLLAVATVTTHYVPGIPAFADEPSPAPSAPPFARHLHEALCAVLEVRPGGGAVIELPPGPAVENAGGRGHGGVLAAVADVVAAAAVDDEEAPLRTTGLRVAYLRPAVLDGPLVLTASVVHRGRSTALTRVDVLGGDGRVCAAASVTAGVDDDCPNP
jgi:uncharacterized protein (TIGR00369 family)